ncbi:MAG: capsular polysaccharide biosynthesis protein, partial [Pseudomonadota bacterium]
MTWGHRPVSRRGAWVARKSMAPRIHVEDPFFRSVRTGRDGDAPLGLLLDHRACHYDSRTPSDLEILLSSHPLDDPGLM